MWNNKQPIQRKKRKNISRVDYEFMENGTFQDLDPISELDKKMETKKRTRENVDSNFDEEYVDRPFKKRKKQKRSLLLKRSCVSVENEHAESEKLSEYYTIRRSILKRLKCLLKGAIVGNDTISIKNCSQERIIKLFHLNENFSFSRPLKINNLEVFRNYLGKRPLISNQFHHSAVLFFNRHDLISILERKTKEMKKEVKKGFHDIDLKGCERGKFGLLIRFMENNYCCEEESEIMKEFLVDIELTFSFYVLQPKEGIVIRNALPHEKK